MSLRPLPAHWVQQRGGQEPCNPEPLPARTRQRANPSTKAVLQFRQCMSLDEQALYAHHPLSEASGATSISFLLATDDPDGQESYSSVKPIQPLYQPPERVKTPEGVPTWRGEVSGRPPSLNLRPATTSLFNQLREFRRVLRRCFGRVPLEETRPVRRWRPPVSGHGIIGCGNEMHPLVAAAAARFTPFMMTSRGTVGGSRGSRHCRTDNSLDEEGSGDTLMRHQRNEQRRRIDVSLAGPTRSHDFTPSQRALRRTSGNPIPVSPGRAHSYTDASNTFRSVSMPSGIQSRGVSRDTSAQGGIDGSTRTIDIIHAFPCPPEPREHGHGQLIAPRGASHSRQVQTEEHGTIVLEDGGSGDLESDHIPCTSINRPSVRDEDRNRYRYLGAPVYDTDAASLCTLDGLADEDEEVQASSNRFSRATQSQGVVNSDRGKGYGRGVVTALGTKVMVKSGVMNNAQQLRAVANGPLRLSSQPAPTNSIKSRALPPDTPQQGQRHEDGPCPFDLTPVTVTQASKTYCHHQITKLRKQENEARKRVPYCASHAMS